MTRTLQVVSHERASNGGFVWYGTIGEAERAFDKLVTEERDAFCEGDEPVAIYLNYAVEVDASSSDDEITGHIDEFLPDIEEKAHKKCLVSAPGVARTTERV